MAHTRMQVVNMKLISPKERSRIKLTRDMELPLEFGLVSSKKESCDVPLQRQTIHRRDVLRNVTRSHAITQSIGM